MRWGRGCGHAVHLIRSSIAVHHHPASRAPTPAANLFSRSQSCAPPALPDLAYDVVETNPPGPGEGGPPAETRTGVLLHGLLGSGRNWRSWTKMLASALEASEGDSGGPPGPRQQWRFILVDLRAHGKSAELPLPPPHSIRSAADDVIRLVARSPWLDGSSSQGGGTKGVADVVIAHSVGGKVALQYCDTVCQGSREEGGASVAPPRQVWVLDSVPAAMGVGPTSKGSQGADEQAASTVKPIGEGVLRREDARDDVERVLEMVVSLPRPFESRRWLVQEVQKRGFSWGLAEWLGSSIKAVDGGSMHFQFDLRGALDLYHSYRTTDLLPVLEAGFPRGTEVHMVRAQRSDRWSAPVLAKLDAAAAAHPESVKLHVLENAGHWLQADNPGGLVNLMVPEMLRISRG